MGVVRPGDEPFPQPGVDQAQRSEPDAVAGEPAIDATPRERNSNSDPSGKPQQQWMLNEAIVEGLEGLEFGAQGFDSAGGPVAAMAPS